MYVGQELPYFILRPVILGMPPYKVAVASPGPHRLTVRPTETEGCNSYIRRNFDFEI